VGWRDLLAKGDETVTLPWLGGRSLRSHAQTWALEGRLPREHGWHKFKLGARTASEPVAAEAQSDLLKQVVSGYLVGDRMVPDGARCEPDPKQIVAFSEKVHLLEDGLDRFARVSAGRIFQEGPLVYRSLEMPLGPEEEVVTAFLDQKTSVVDIKGVSPALDAAFRMEIWQREETERRRRELERLRREEEERLEKEARRQALVEKLGDAKGRREMAKYDFAEAAKAALAVGGAEVLDHRKNVRKGEWVVKYRLDGQRFECVCDENLRIVDAGICLVDHDTEERGDTFFTLESLPAVIREAIRRGKLVIFRHV
jgi:hypothetical protein